MSRDTRLARVERLERSLAEPPPSDQPLSRAELHELLALEAARQARFPGEIDTWDAAMLADFLSWSAGNGGSAQRLDSLRQRTRSPEQRAEDRAMDVAVSNMDALTLDLFMAEMAATCSPEPKGNGSCP